MKRKRQRKKRMRCTERKTAKRRKWGERDKESWEVSELKKREREWFKMKRVEIEIWRGKEDSQKERNKTTIKDKVFLWPSSTKILTKLFNLLIYLKLR